MIVTGLVVNEKINIDRRYIKRVRAMLHDLTANGLNRATKNHFQTNSTHKNSDLHKLFIQRLRGSLAFIGQIRGTQDPAYRKYRHQLNSFLQKQSQEINPLT
jgi:RNA-directed DNA polymerase